VVVVGSRGMAAAQDHHPHGRYLGRLLDEVVDHLRRGVVHLHVEVFEATREVVVEPHRRDGNDEAERGFSFSRDGPLDMRMDPSRGESAADWLARATEREIADVIYELGEERFARRIAATIIAARSETPITRTAALAAIVQRAVRSRDGKHPATRSFQAIRMHVNDELGQLQMALEAAFTTLAVGGRLAVISFHSLEDRIVKQFIRVKCSVDPVFAGLPVIPPQAQPVMREVGRKRRAGDAELARNPRARSAVLRCAEKLAAAPVVVRGLS